jgi:uncharacterized protein (TIGR02246 family)
MKRRDLFVLAGFVMALTAAACGGAPEMAMQGTAEDEAAIRGLADRYVAAFNAHDAAGIAALAADDYMAVAPDGTVVSGKAGVEKMQMSDMQMMQKMNMDMQLSAAVDFVHWLNAENATIGGTYALEGTPAEANSRGSFLVVAHKSADGEWLMVGDLGAPFIPPPAPAPPAN